MPCPLAAASASAYADAFVSAFVSASAARACARVAAVRRITDGTGEVEEVSGPGVIGMYPVLQVQLCATVLNCVQLRLNVLKCA